MIVHEKDVIYGRVGGAALLADLAYPSDRESLPAIMYVHGGRWFMGVRAGNALWEDLNVVKWAERGFFAVSIDYRLHRRPTRMCSARFAGSMPTRPNTESIPTAST